MSLFVNLIVIAFLNAYNSRIVSLLMKLIPQDAQIKATANDISDLEKELSTISMTDEFAKYFKLERKIIKLKNEKMKKVKSQAFRRMKIRYFFVILLYLIAFVAILNVLWFHRSESVAQVPAHWIWPFEQIFSWAHGTPGSISVPFWIAISSSASKAIARIF